MNNYVKALKEAKKLITRSTVDGSQHSKYICIALGHVSIKDKILAPYCNRIIEYIDECMGDCSGCCLEMWLSKQGIVDESDDYIVQNLAEEMYQYRLRWIDELIRLYEGKKNDQ